MPYFSIIIPLYNKEKFIEKTLESVLSQTYQDFEVIIINDGSTDSSVDKILTFNDPRIQLIHQENQGVSSARNLGIKKAKGKYICFLDADDYWYPDFLKTIHHYSLKLPEQKVFAVAIEVETKNNLFQAQYSIQRKDNFEIVNFFESSLKEAVLWTSSACFQKNVFEEVGGFDINIKKGEDTELWIRIGLHYPIVFIWKILAKYVYDDKSISKNANYFLEDYTFTKYALEEKKNLNLKKYMDLNRFSAVIKCKVTGNHKKAKKIRSEIDMKRLSLKKRILLYLPSFSLKILIQLKSYLADNGLENSIFK